MHEVWLYSLISVIIVSLISFVGILTLSIKANKLKKILLYMVSFSAGGLFGDAFIHLLPEIIEEVGFSLNISLYAIFGIVFSFVVEKFIRWRHCHLPTTKEHQHPFAIMNLFGDAVHNFMDGLIIGASYLASIPVGIATTLAVVFHEIPQEIADFGVLLHGGFSKGKALFFNFMTALTAVIGAVAAIIISSYVQNVTYFLIPFAAGGFIYIAGSDLIPELHKEVKVKKSLIQITLFILGVGVMVLLLLLD
ncbi:MAG: ZIP family metal transporter [Nanoarchaeota archaeon]|nr:ZIP family metal transporter [DPANN group archaeon]MBL7116261.1 ZIP family metal transporter [Nanoarchaeota archaeon]